MYKRQAVSLNKAHKIILVGDHQQLPPVLDTEIIRNNKEKLDEEGLAQGIFERMYNMFPEDNKHRLTIQSVSYTHLNIFGYAGGSGYGIVSSSNYKEIGRDGEYSVIATDMSSASEGTGILFNLDGEVIGICV